MPKKEERKILNWIDVLNEHSEWTSDGNVNKWLAGILQKEDAHANKAACKAFFETLSQIRTCIYESHFCSQTSTFAWLNEQLKNIHLIFDISPEAKHLHLPPLRGQCASLKNDEDILNSIRVTILLQFANDLSATLSSGGEICGRCEGLYRDTNAVRLSMVPAVDDSAELLWRAEIDLLVDHSLESEKEIQRCADIFPAAARSKYCSDKCRFNTFQIVKQYKDPNYLAEKQRRYRAKKTDTST